jgi:hypothetical protein
VGNVENLSLGPGILYVAAVGSTAPTNVTTAWAAAWKEIGYTSEGSEISIDLTNDPVDVAEEVDPVFHINSARTVSVSFAMAEITARNLTIAMNGGTVSTAAGVTTYTPPSPAQAQRVALGWQSEDGTERWIFPKTFQAGGVSVARRKGADKATIPVEMRAEKPAVGKVFTVLFKDSRSGGTV